MHPTAFHELTSPALNFLYGIVDVENLERTNKCQYNRMWMKAIIAALVDQFAAFLAELDDEHYTSIMNMVGPQYKVVLNALKSLLRKQIL